MTRHCGRILRSRRTLAPAIVVAALLITTRATTAGAHDTKPPPLHGYILATFAGEAEATFKDGSASDITDGAFRETTIIPFELAARVVTLHLAQKRDRASGSAYEQKTSPVYNCSANYELLEQLHPTETSSSGVRFWTRQDHGVFPDPGADDVLVTGAPFWNDFERTSPAVTGCLTATSPSLLYQLEKSWHKTLMCVPRGAPTCHDLQRLSLTVGCASGCTQTYTAIARLAARTLTTSPELNLTPFLTRLVDVYLTQFSPPAWLQIGKSGAQAPPRLVFAAVPPPEDGSLVVQVTIGSTAIVKSAAKISRGARASLPLTWSQAGLGLAQRIRRPTLITATATFTPSAGAPVTFGQDAYVLPLPTKAPAGRPGAGAAITSVTVGGSTTNPQITVHGTAFGKLSLPNPSGHPSGQNGCPAIAGDNGYDYGTSLYIAVPAKNWAGGRYRPSVNELDCIDLVVKKFTPTEVVFHFGPFYAQHRSQFSLENGDVVQVAVNGAVLTVHVRYGATVSS